MYMTILSANKDTLTSSFPNCIPMNSFNCNKFIKRFKALNSSIQTGMALEELRILHLVPKATRKSLASSGSQEQALIHNGWCLVCRNMQKSSDFSDTFGFLYSDTVCPSPHPPGQVSCLALSKNLFSSLISPLRLPSYVTGCRLFNCQLIHPYNIQDILSTGSVCRPINPTVVSCAWEVQESSSCSVP